LTSLTPYSECLERVRSVLVFFAATGRGNTAVLAELESEVRLTVSASRVALLPIDDVEKDLDQLAAMTLPEGPGGMASRLMRTWIAMASGRTSAEPPSRADGDTSTSSDLR
jgi:hypothetical protein